MRHRRRPAFSGAASALPFECAVYRAARATGKEVCRRWLVAIETQSEMKLERPTLHAASRGAAVRSSQRRKKRKEEGGRTAEKQALKLPVPRSAHSVPRANRRRTGERLCRQADRKIRTAMAVQDRCVVDAGLNILPRRQNWQAGSSRYPCYAGHTETAGSQHGHRMAVTWTQCNVCGHRLDDGPWCAPAEGAAHCATFIGRSFAPGRTATARRHVAPERTALPTLRPYHRRPGFRTAACADGLLAGTRITVFQTATHLSANALTLT